MQRLTISVIILLGGVIAFGACGAGPKTVTLSREDAGSTVELQVGDTLVVVLEGNPTTGYQWEVAPEGSDLLQQLGDPEFEPDSDAIGSGGQVTLRFEAVAAGQTTLQLIYHRPWEDVDPLESFEVTVVIKEK